MMPLKSILTVDNSSLSLENESKPKLKFIAIRLLWKLMTWSHTHTHAHQSKSSATSNKSSGIRKFYCPINSIPAATTKQRRLNEEENCRKITCCVYVESTPPVAIKHKRQILLARSYSNECEHKEAIKTTISLLMALLLTTSFAPAFPETWKDCAWHLPHLSRLPLKCKLKRHSFGD